MKAAWCYRELIESPYAFCLCVNEAQYQKEMDRFRVAKADRGDWVAEGKDAALHTLVSNDGDHVAIVCVRPKKDRTLNQLHALLVHEAMHLWRYIREDLGENDPSKEFEAYSMQALSQRLFYAYDDLTKKRKKKK